MSAHDDMLAALEVSQRLFLEQLTAQLVPTLRAQPIAGAQAVQIGTTTGAPGRNPASAASGRLLGYSFAAGSDAAAVQVLDGVDDAGDLLACEAIAADGSITRWFGPGGIGFLNGCYINVTAGELTGAVWLLGPQS